MKHNKHLQSYVHQRGKSYTLMYVTTKEHTCTVRFKTKHQPPTELEQSMCSLAQARPSYTQSKKNGAPTLETAHDGRLCWYTSYSEIGRHPPAAVTRCRPSDATTLGGEAENGQSKTTKTLATSAAACTWKKWPKNCTTKEAGVTPTFGTSEIPVAVYTAAQYLKMKEEEQSPASQSRKLAEAHSRLAPVASLP